MKAEEIKPQNLRIGNYLQWKESNYCVTVTGISEDAEGWILDYADHETSLENGLWLDHFTYIPITTECLEKFGFEKSGKDMHIKHSHYWAHPKDSEEEEISFGVYLHWMDESFVLIELHNEHGEHATYPMKHMKYIHQLQNTWYDLTGIGEY